MDEIERLIMLAAEAADNDQYTRAQALATVAIAIELRYMIALKVEWLKSQEREAAATEDATP